MNNFAINNLANMEFMLYGGRSGMNMNCPSMYNGYMGANNMMNYYNPMFRGYGNNRDIFTQYNDATRVNNSYKTAGNGSSQVDWNNPQFKGLSDDINELGNYYINNSAPSESLLGAAVGGAAFGVIQNPRMIAHWYNALRSTPEVSKMFADIKVNGSKLNLLWNNQAIYKGQKFAGGYEIVSEAYARMHKLESLTKGKLGWFRRSLSKQPELMAEYETIKKGLANALKEGNPEKIAKWTDAAKKLGNRYTGFIPKGLRALHLQTPMTWLRKKINPSQYEKLTEEGLKKTITESSSKSTLKSSLGHSCKLGSGLFFTAIEFLMDAGKIQTAFSKDTSTGMTQVGQTAIKGVGSAVGWAVGEGIGAWAGAKLGAAIGTAVAPGVGTAIGAVAGLIGGSIGCWLAGKITHKIVGQDVGTKVEVENMKKTAQGQQQLLQLTLQQAQDDKKIGQRTFQALQNVANYYGAGA